MLGGEGAAQICRKYSIYPSLLYHWKDMYSRGRFNNEPTEAGALKDRVEKLERLERLVGKLTLENEIFKKGLSEQPQSVSRKRQAIKIWGCLGVAI